MSISRPIIHLVFDTGYAINTTENNWIPIQEYPTHPTALFLVIVVKVDQGVCKLFLMFNKNE